MSQPLTWRGSLLALQRVLRLSVIFILPLTLVVSLFAVGALQMLKPMMRDWVNRDLDERSQLMAKALRDPIAEALRTDQVTALRQQLGHLVEDQSLFAVAVCDVSAKLVAASINYPAYLGCNGSVRGAEARFHLNRIVLPEAGATLMVLYQPRVAWQRSDETQRVLLWSFVSMVGILALLTVGMAHWSWRKWVDGVRRILRNGGQILAMDQAAPEIQPLLPDLRRLLRSVHEDRRILKDTTIEWRPETLKLLLREHLSGDEVIVVSNREPYIHQRTKDGGIVVQRPASGLITAVEPVMRACSGIWVAHGSGSADADVVNARSSLRVPPQAENALPVSDSYTLHRVWLSPEEEKGYYYGFANEGLWPLCHIAHVRPVFREEDWLQYQAVNQRFADAVVNESRTDNPVILVQDYHFALLPKLLKERLPKATVISFWHIPWPNPESFGICPWAREILEGMLGSTILGFHTRYHCENFLETVDRFLESRISREDDSVLFQGHRTKVRDYPISIHWPAPATQPAGDREAARHVIEERFNLPPGHCLAIGVDRLDYTKGIVERLLAVERLLDTQPQWRGRFSLIQIAAPTRSSLDEYSRLDRRVREEAQRINNKVVEWMPEAPPAIILLIEQHDSASVHLHYRACEIAMVTSLHDGMNLVAKEFVAARDTEDGVLILSQFAGAAGEMSEALIVNPYHIGEMAQTLAQALTMHPAEQRERMRAMRQRLSDFNIYRWAGRMLLDAADERKHERFQDRLTEVSRRQRFPWTRGPVVRARGMVQPSSQAHKT